MLEHAAASAADARFLACVGQDERQGEGRALVQDDQRAAEFVQRRDESERRASVYRAIESLPDDQKRVIVMRFADEKSIREIAVALGRSEGAVKQLQFRAMENLRGSFSEKANG